MLEMHVPYFMRGSNDPSHGVLWKCSCRRGGVSTDLRAARSSHKHHLRARLRHEKADWVAAHSATFHLRPDGLWVWECACGRWTPNRRGRPFGATTRSDAVSGHTRHAKRAAEADIRNRLETTYE